MRTDEGPDRAGWAAALAAADTRLCRSVRGGADGREAMIAVSRLLSSAGEHALIWLGTGAVGAVLDRPRRSRWAVAVAGVAGAHAAAMVTKRVVRRPRPDLPGLPPLTSTLSGLSFPSAHAASSAAAAVVFSGLLPAPIRVPVAAATCAARVVVGAHYPTDVLAGAAMGATVGGLVRRWTRAGAGVGR